MDGAGIEGGTGKSWRAANAPATILAPHGDATDATSNAIDVAAMISVRCRRA
jgi:hypothetical protein